MSQFSSNFSIDQFTSQNLEESINYGQEAEQQSKNQTQQRVNVPRQEGRNYGCPCGKYYLSAAALYTHVKIKHNGVPPGKLSRPAANPAGRRPTRGRARATKNTVIVDTVQQDSDMIFDPVEQLNKRLQNITIQYQEEEPQRSEGSETCQDMSSDFLIDIKAISKRQMKIVICFLNCLKQFTRKRLGDQYWEQGQPGKIIQIANQFVKSHNQQQQKKYPLKQSILIDLLYILCRWMYKEKWTNNKLIRRTSAHVYLKNAL